MVDEIVEFKVVIDKKSADKSFDELKSSVDNFGDELAGTNKIVKQAEDVLDDLDKTVDGLEKNTDKAGKSFVNMQSVMKNGAIAFTAIAVAGAATLAVLVKLADAGEQLGSVTGYFEQLGGQVDIIDRATEASLGLVTRLDLITIANKGLIAGLPDVNANFEKIADAGTRLANILNKDVKGTIEALTNAIAKGQTRQLQQLGLIVDQDKAWDDYAATLGTTREQLSLLQKQEAIQIESLRQLDSLLAETEAATDSVANAYAAVTNSITDAIGETGIAVNENKNLTEAFRNLGDAIGEVDLKTLGEALADIASIFVELSAQIVSFAATFTDQLKFMVDGALFWTEILKQVAGGELPDPDKAAAVILTNKIADSLDNLSTKAVTTVPKITATNEAFSKGSDEVEKYGSNISSIVLQSQALADILDELSSNQITNAQAQDRVNFLYADLGTTIAQLAEKQATLNELLDGTTEASEDTGDTVFVLTKEIAGLEAELDKFSTKKPTEELFNFEKAMLSVTSSIESGFADSIGSIGSSIINGSFNTDSAIDIGQQFGATAGGAAGQALGTALGGPIGGEIGGQLGGAIGDKVAGKIVESVSDIGSSTQSSIAGILDSGALGFSTLGFADDIFSALGFGSNNLGAVAREQVDGFFKDLFDGRRIGLVIDGQFTELEGIVINSTETFQNSFLDSIDTSTDVGAKLFGGFDAVSTAIAALTGVGQEFSGQIATGIANTIGGSLDSLRFLVRELGLDFETLEESIVQSFFAGDLAAGEAAQALHDLPSAFEPGLVAVGAFEQGFQNLIDSAGKGSFAIKSSQDVAIEAQEAGIESLDALQANLLASGKFTEEQITKFFQSLETNGITTLDELANASDRVAISVLGFLDNSGGFFEDLSEGAAETNERVETLGKNLDALEGREVNTHIVLKVRTEYEDSESRQNLELASGAGVAQAA
ncbi:MAG: hypothetical protein ACPG5L_07465 [Vibrio gallaecicus]